MRTHKEVVLNKPLTEEQLKMIDEAENRPVVFDEDCPELTETELAEFRRVADMRNEYRKKQVVTIRLSSQTLAKAKSLGKGYTSILSRIIEEALNDKEFIRKCL